MTSSDPLRATNSILNVGTSTGVFKAWENMQMSPLVVKPFMFDISAVMPDYGKIMAPAMTEISKILANTVTVAYPKNHLDSILKMVVQSSGIEVVAKAVLASNAEMMRGFYPSVNVMSGLFGNDQLRLPLAALTKSVVTSIDTSYLSDILATAATFSEELAEQDVDELTDEFFENHPELAESIEELPALYTLSAADRLQVIWFVRICVLMSVTCVMLNISVEHPELDSIIDALGISGGLAAGKKAGDLTGKALDKLPQAKDN